MELTFLVTLTQYPVPRMCALNILPIYRDVSQAPGLACYHTEISLGYWVHKFTPVVSLYLQRN